MRGEKGRNKRRGARKERNGGLATKRNPSKPIFRVVSFARRKVKSVETLSIFFHLECHFASSSTRLWRVDGARCFLRVLATPSRARTARAASRVQPEKSFLNWRQHDFFPPSCRGEKSSSGEWKVRKMIAYERCASLFVPLRHVEKTFDQIFVT